MERRYEKFLYHFENQSVQSSSSTVPKLHKPIIVKRDSSACAADTRLSQEDEKGRSRPIRFAIHKIDHAERNYSVCENEALAVIPLLQKFRSLREIGSVPTSD